MTWDPEIDDRPRRDADRGGDVGLLREPARDPRAPIDATAPVSGHVPPRSSSVSVAESPEQSWAAAQTLIFPALRPHGTSGMRLDDLDRAALEEAGRKHHCPPILDDGPADLPVVYALASGGFDVFVNCDHLLSWGVEPGDLQEAALTNLSAWSATAPWTDEVSGDRRLISSDSGDGWDAARVLLPECREHLAHELGGGGARVLIGVPERHLLIAGALRPGDEEFAGLFADFIAAHSEGADEPIDRRVFEIVDGRLVEFSA